jgi:hypothetical protein
MVYEWLPDCDLGASAWRCVNCGAILDPTIFRNQGIPAAKAMAGSAASPHRSDSRASRSRLKLVARTINF